MDAVGPHVHEVDLREVTVHEGGVVGLPLLGEPGDRGRREPGRVAEELLQRGHEVAGGQAVQVEQQHLTDLRGLAAPRREDRQAEPLALARCLVDALVVHPRRLHLHHAGRRGHFARLVVAISHDQAVALLVSLTSQLGYVSVDFSLQRGGQHPPRTLADDLVDQRRAVGGGAVGVHYAEHGRAFPTRAATRAYSIPVNRSLGKVRPSRVPSRADPQVMSIARGAHTSGPGGGYRSRVVHLGCRTSFFCSSDA